MDKPRCLYFREGKKGGNWYLNFRFHGKRIRRLYGPSRKGAENAIAKIKGEIAENKFLDKRPEEKPVAFHDFAVEYVRVCSANWKRVGGRLSHLRKLERELGAKNLQDITAWQIEKYKAKRKGEVKPASVNRELALIKHFLTKAVEWNKLKENPAKKVKLLKGEVKRTRFLMPDEIQTLLGNCDPRVRDIVTVTVHTGMRAGEIHSLRRDQVNWNSGVITLTDTKNQERRDVPMNETVKAVLRSINNNDDRFFPGGYARIKRYFGQAVRASGISDFRFHDLRHCFASNLVMNGTDLNTVRELLGHKSMAMTLRYSHLAPNLKSKAVEVLDQVLGGAPVLPQKSETSKVVSISTGNR
jgi:integrase